MCIMPAGAHAQQASSRVRAYWGHPPGRSGREINFKACFSPNDEVWPLEWYISLVWVEIVQIWGVSVRFSRSAPWQAPLPAPVIHACAWP